MHGAAFREYPCELIVGHARPVPDVSGIEMDKRRSGGRIKSDAATLQAKPGETDLLQRHLGDEEVHRVAKCVLAVTGDPRRAPAQHRVGGGGAVGGDDLDRLLAVDVAIDLPENIEEVTVHHRLILAAPVAQIVIELFERLFVVAALALEGDGQVLVGMGVMEGEGAGFVQRRRIMDRPCAAEQQQQRREARLVAGTRHRPVHRQRSELAR